MGDPQGENRRSMIERFRDAASVDLNNWRDFQHDLEALRLATEDELTQIEQFLIGRGIRSYADVEVLALLDTVTAREELLKAFQHGDSPLRAAIALLVPHLIDEQELVSELLKRITECDAYQGLDLTLQQIEATHPPAVQQAMLERVVRDPGVVAVHFAGMLLYLNGKASEPFDWQLRPFLLRFNPGDQDDRRAALIELCDYLGKNPADNLGLM